MNGNEKSNAPASNPATLTSARLQDLVLDHMLANPALFVINEESQINTLDHFRDVMDCLVRMAHQIATESLVNRQHLSPLPTFDGSIDADPDADESGNAMSFATVW